MQLFFQQGVDPATCPPVILVGNKCDLVTTMALGNIFKKLDLFTIVNKCWTW